MATPAEVTENDEVAGNAAEALRTARRAGWALVGGGMVLAATAAVVGAAIFGAGTDGAAGVVVIGVVLVTAIGGLGGLAVGGALLGLARTTASVLAWSPLRPAGPLLTEEVDTGPTEHGSGRTLIAAVARPGDRPVAGALRPLWPSWSLRAAPARSTPAAWAAGPVGSRSVVAVDEGRSLAVIASPGNRQPAVVDERLRLLTLALPDAPARSERR